MEIKDLFLTPIYLLILYGLIFYYRNTIQDPVVKSYFLPAFHLKIIGSILFGLVYQFYYRGGDTFNFFNDTKPIWAAFLNNPFLGIRIIFLEMGDFSPELYNYTSRIYFYSAGDTQNFFIIRIAAFLGFFTFNTYTVTGLLFATLSFSGMWKMYLVFYDMFPKLHRPLAYAVFFIPSVYFWGSGLMKDSITIGALGWLLYAIYFGLMRGKQTVQNVLIALISAYIIQKLKIYILLAFIPSLSVWLFVQYRNYIHNPLLRFLALPFMLLLSIPLAYFSINQITAEQERYQLANIVNTAQVTADWLQTVSEREGGSGYSLGEFDGSVGGLIRKIPQAVWLGLFQPHPWQVRNIVMLLSSVEATLFLYITVRIFFQLNILKLYAIFLKNPILIYCLFFSLVLAYGSAISSSNYGTMVRYRIPLMPFYLAMLYIIRFQINGSKKLF